MILDLQSQRRLLAATGYAELSLFQDAVQELEELPETFREQPTVLAVWLDVYQRWQKWLEAEFVATRLCEIEPNSPVWVIGLAYAARRNRGLRFADDILKQAVEKFPDCATIQFNLACYAAQLGHTDEALVRLRRAIELDKTYAAAAKTDPDLEPLRGGLG
jgi:tetratricopeptide (TPR) repeat protein